MQAISLHEYSINHSDQVIRFSSTLDPDAMRICLKQLYQLFRSVDASDIVIDSGEDGAELRTHLVEPENIPECQTINRLVDAMQQQTTEDESQQCQVIGDGLLKAYKRWGTQCSATRTTNSLRSWQTEAVVNKMTLVEDIASNCSEHIRNIFELRMQRHYSVEQCMRSLHVSSATFHRQWRTLKCQLGWALLQRCTDNMQVAALLLDD